MARRAQKKIDYTHWTLLQGSALAFGVGTVGISLLPAQHQPETLLRIRGILSAYVDGVQAPGVSSLLNVGIIPVPEGTGTTVLWSPFTDADAPWIWFGSYWLGYEEMVVDVVDVPAITGVRDVIDSKAMRILRNQELQIVFENTAIGGGGTAVNALVMARALSGH